MGVNGEGERSGLENKSAMAGIQGKLRETFGGNLRRRCGVIA